MSDPFLEAEEADYVRRLQTDKCKAETSRDNWRNFGGVVILTVVGIMLNSCGIGTQNVRMMDAMESAYGDASR